MTDKNFAETKWIIGLLIASALIFFVSLAYVYYRDDIRNPSASEQSYPPPKTY